jgi:hypothetical protein
MKSTLLFDFTSVRVLPTVIKSHVKECKIVMLVKPAEGLLRGAVRADMLVAGALMP